MASPRLWCSVEDDPPLQFGAERFAECAEGLELVSISRDELASPVLDMGQGTKSVVLDLEQPVLMGERFRTPAELKWLEFHYSQYSVQTYDLSIKDY